jgi:cell division protein FtsQ
MRVAIIAGLVLLALGVVWLVWFSSVLQVREVRVVGIEGARAQEAQTIAAVPLGIPLARLDAASAEERLRAVPWVASAEVRRGWPSEVVIAVTGREAVAAVADDSGQQAIDDQGVVFTPTEPLPKRLPRIRAEGAALTAAVAVLQSLPPDLRDRVVSLSATTRDDVDLILRSGDEVRWGSADQAEMKAEVLRVLLKRKADMYDVSAPELPTTFRLG